MILDVNKYSEWNCIYEPHLESIYRIFLKYSEMTNEPYLKDKFYRLIYKKSSKRIPYYEKEEEIYTDLNEW
jgi:hypothetical protein